ncbi:FAD/NAD(P)-binding protein [Paracoccus caeni]|uniref:FAD/NAD(P)-binding protein n=1 Tax=Paracoccus caeni TaxID=657651 RepID=A0A934SH69_9RHOB|nr:FAD/NAD(P)-binding domain-containing protein [Paracoccus caeni]MBK4215332.1 FAD/NAD(P)-binding protein [Paracoccus caeni]
MDDNRISIAVIGAGPRALGALEALARRLKHSDHPVGIDIFDPDSDPGAGPNFMPDDSPLMLLNLPLRNLDLGQASAFPDLTDWLAPALASPERYPPRAEIGSYLAARFNALATTSLHLRVIRNRATALHRVGNRWHIEAGRIHGPYDEVLLTQGQPESLPDDQLRGWQDHAATSPAELLNAYPGTRLLDAAQNWAGRVVAIRGLGLSTLDVMRLMTIGLGGRFKDGRYHPSGREPSRIIPFSPDGQPPIPKPANAALDALFEPTEAETAAFRDALQTAIRGGSDDATNRLCAAFVTPATRILRQTGGDVDALHDWLETEKTDPGTQDSRDTASALRSGLAEANGTAPPSPGYVTGQLMRKWQNELRKGFNPARIAPETAKAIIGFDEGLKRYSYGPPVESAAELLTLIEAGLVQPRIAGEDDVTTTPDGWQLDRDDPDSATGIMVDAVLPSPDLAKVSDPLLAGLLKKGHIKPFADGLGARTDADGRVAPGLSLLGRMAIGSVIAVDSLHDCFGATADRWAKAVLART